MLILGALKHARSRLVPTRAQQLAMAASEACTRRLSQPLPPDVDTPALVHRFVDTLNMSPEEVERFLDSAESRQAAENCLQGRGGPREARKWCRRVVELLQKVGERREDPQEYPLSLLYEGDLEQMYQVLEFIQCARKELPPPDSMEQSPLRHELMLFGYDPLKERSSAAATLQQ